MDSEKERYVLKGVAFDFIADVVLSIVVRARDIPALVERTPDASP